MAFYNDISRFVHSLESYYTINGVTSESTSQEIYFWGINANLDSEGIINSLGDLSNKIFAIGTEGGISTFVNTKHNNTKAGAAQREIHFPSAIYPILKAFKEYPWTYQNYNNYYDIPEYSSTIFDLTIDDKTKAYLSALLTVNILTEPNHSWDFRGLRWRGNIVKDEASDILQAKGYGTSYLNDGVVLNESSYIEIESFELGTPFTMELYYTSSVLDSISCLLQFSDSTKIYNGENSFAFYKMGSGTSSMTILHSGSNNNKKEFENTFISNTETHLVITVDTNGTIILYNNGDKSKESTFIDISGNDTPPFNKTKRDFYTLGGGLWDTAEEKYSHSFNGVMYYFRVWNNKILSETEVSILYLSLIHI